MLFTTRKTMNRARISFLVFMLPIILFAAEVIKYPVGSASTLSVGTVVKITADVEVAPCDEGDEAVGIITAIEEFASFPDSFLVGSGGIAVDVTVAAGVSVNAGEKIVPADGGKVQPLSADLDGYIVGTALDSGIGGEKIRIIINVFGTPNGAIKSQSTNYKLYNR